MRSIAVADVGGTHARFALASIDAGRVLAIDEPVTLKSAEHASFELAWEEFARRRTASLPGELAIAFAGPVGHELLRLTNNPWVIRPRSLSEGLGLNRLKVVNDFAAVAHAVAVLPDEQFRSICGPERPLPDEGVISIVGPGTGLGVAALLRTGSGYEIIDTEGGHIDFAPLDPIEDQILVQLRRIIGRVSVERIASGQGLWNLYEALTRIEGRDRSFADEASLWAAALAGSDSLAAAALHRLVLSLGAICGDLALAHGAMGLVLAGGIGRRLADHLGPLGFCDRFIAKGRFEPRMKDMPVKLVTYPEPGLWGAAAAFAREHG